MQNFTMPDSWYDPPDPGDGPEDEVWPTCTYDSNDAMGEGPFPDLCGECAGEVVAQANDPDRDRI